jgi:hypothetical protein
VNLSKMMRKMWTVAVLFVGTLAYLATIAGVMLFGLIWEGCSKLSAAIRSLRSGRSP